jgi:xanthine dehydrogenase accessory factor
MCGAWLAAAAWQGLCEVLRCAATNGEGTDAAAMVSNHAHPFAPRRAARRLGGAQEEGAAIGAPSYRDFLAHLNRVVELGEKVAVATVVAVEGSASARPGAKSIIDAQGRRVFGWVGGGCAESAVRDAALASFADHRPRTLRLDLDDEVLGVGMPCGGYMTVYVEPVLPQPRLLILGHGVIAETLADMGARLEFEVAVNDPLASADRFPSARERVTDDPEYAKLDCSGDTYVVITTQHKSDYEALHACLRLEPAYVGLVASRKRSALLFERLREDGMSPQALQCVHSPCGLDIGAATPQEIAVSILAEIVRQRRGSAGSGRPLVETKGVRITETGVEIPAGALDSERCPR